MPSVTVHNETVKVTITNHTEISDIINEEPIDIGLPEKIKMTSKFIDFESEDGDSVELSDGTPLEDIIDNGIFIGVKTGKMYIENMEDDTFIEVKS